jgi:enoyl-CoA hydratase/carnithine racemase
MSIAPKGFLYEVKDGVATITLNRPDKLNALTFEIYAELRETMIALDTEPGVRAIILTGAGRAFCSGGDYDAIIKNLLERDYPGLLAFTRMTGGLILAIRRCHRPVIAALNGLASGAGAVIAAACDFRIASESAKIAFLFTSKVGLSGADMGASYLLPRIVGLARASEILMMGEFLEAKDAERIGLYHRVVPQEKVASTAREWAERLARGPSFALAMTKELLNREMSLDLDSALEAESEVQAICMQSPNFRESYEAFKAKRPPKFV